MGHKGSVFLPQLVLPLAICFASEHVFIPDFFFLPSCLSTIFRQVVFGRPNFRVPSGVHVKVVMQWLSSAFLNICPIHTHLLIFTSVLIFSNVVLFRISLFDIIYGHLTLRILLGQLSVSTPRLSVSTPRLSVSTPRLSVSTPRLSVSTPRLSLSFTFQVSYGECNTTSGITLNICCITGEVAMLRSINKAVDC